MKYPVTDGTHRICGNERTIQGKERYEMEIPIHSYGIPYTSEIMDITDAESQILRILVRNHRYYRCGITDITDMVADLRTWLRSHGSHRYCS